MGLGDASGNTLSVTLQLDQSTWIEVHPLSVPMEVEGDVSNVLSSLSSDPGEFPQSLESSHGSSANLYNLFCCCCTGSGLVYKQPLCRLYVLGSFGSRLELGRCL